MVEESPPRSVIDSARRSHWPLMLLLHPSDSLVTRGLTVRDTATLRSGSSYCRLKSLAAAADAAINDDSDDDDIDNDDR